jgi:DNA primase
MDANDYAREMQSPEKSLGDLLRKSEWMGKGVEPNKDEARAHDDREPALSHNRSDDAPVKEPHAADTPMSTGDGGEVVFTFGHRRWRVRGLERNTSHGELRVNILVNREGSGFHVDTLDLYSAKQRVLFIKQAAIEIGTTDDTVTHPAARLGKAPLGASGEKDEENATVEAEELLASLANEAGEEDAVANEAMET